FREESVEAMLPGMTFQRPFGPGFTYSLCGSEVPRIEGKLLGKLGWFGPCLDFFPDLVIYVVIGSFLSQIESARHRHFEITETALQFSRLNDSVMTMPAVIRKPQIDSA